MKFKLLLEEESEKIKEKRLVSAIQKIINTEENKSDFALQASSRNWPNLRLKCFPDEAESILQKALKMSEFSLEDPDIDLKELSGKYKIAYKLVFPKGFNNFEPNSFCYVIPLLNAKTTNAKGIIVDGLITKKQTTPVNILGSDSSKDFTKNELYEIVKAKINDPNSIFGQESYQYIRRFMNDLLDASVFNQSEINSENAKNIGKTDLSRITQDFGEIVVALRSFDEYKDIGMEYVYFPSASNEPVVDFYGKNANGEICVNISVKSGTGSSKVGAAPSLTAVNKFVEDLPPSDYVEIIKIASEVKGRSVVEKILEIGKILDPIAIELIRKAIKKEPTVENISDFCKKHLSFDELNYEFSEFFEHIHKMSKRAPFKATSVTSMKAKLEKDIDTYDNVAGKENPKKKGITYSGFVLSPLAYYIMDFLNAKQDFLEFLTNVIRNLIVVQANIVVTLKNVSFDFRPFSTNYFKFEYHSNATNPGGNNFGFVMIK